MINLRYHVFSLIAVFAALAIGIVVGSTTVRSGLVDNLRGNVRRAEQRITEVEGENDELVARSRQLDLLGTDGTQLVAGATLGVPVLWVAGPGVDDEVWQGVERMALSAGAVTIGRVRLDRDVFDDGEIDTIATAVGSDATDPDEVRADLGALLASRIDRALDLVEVGTETAPGTGDGGQDSGRRSRRTTTTTQPLLGPDAELALTVSLGDLEDAGLVDLRDLQTGGVPEGAVVQIVVLEDLRSGIDASPVLLSLVDELSGSSDRDLVLSEARPVRRPPEGPVSVVAQVRDSGRLSDEMSTVDNLEDSPGWIATVLAVRNAVVGDLGHYGYRDGSDALLPPPVQ